MAVGRGRPRTSREAERAFWRLVRQGLSTADATAAVGVSAATGERWLAFGGGMPTIDLREPRGRHLVMGEREEFAVLLAQGLSQAEIARRTNRHPSTVSRELRRNKSVHGLYRATAAQSHAERRARRPKARKLARCPELAGFVQARLEGRERCSPEQISRLLREQFPDDEGMQISHEAIYQSIYVQGRGGLRRELHTCLRTGRALRKPNRQPGARRERIKDMVMISERPAEVEDRAVPGHWEGDLILGANNKSAIGTLVERTTRFVMLLHLKDQCAETVREAIAATILTLPEALRKTLTWDQGSELAQHMQLRFDTGLEVYFCDPHSPWQRGSNENTNGLLRQYFPKGTSLRKYTPEDLADVAAGMNGRPRKTLGWKTPAEALARFLTDANTAGIATTP